MKKRKKETKCMLEMSSPWASFIMLESSLQATGEGNDQGSSSAVNPAHYNTNLTSKTCSLVQ